MEKREQLLKDLTTVKKQIAQILTATERQVNIVSSFRQLEAGITTDTSKAKLTMLLVILGVVYALFMAIIGSWGTILLLAGCAAIIYTHRGRKSKLKKAAVAMAAIDILYFMYLAALQILGGNLALLILFLLVLTLSVLAVGLAVKGHNAVISRRNAKAEAENAALQEQYEETVLLLKALKKQLFDFSGSWYPRDYYSLESVNFFLSAVANFKADTMKEAVLLLDDTQYKQKMLTSQQEIERLNREQVFNQQKMIGQLAFANVMSIQNLSLQHSQLRATNANTAAVSKAGSRVAASVDQAGRQVVNALHQLSQ